LRFVEDEFDLIAQASLPHVSENRV
jgi:hypothetical protein